MLLDVCYDDIASHTIWWHLLHKLHDDCVHNKTVATFRNNLNCAGWASVSEQLEFKNLGQI